MGIVNELLQDIPIPKMVKVKQHFEDHKLENFNQILKDKLEEERIKETVKPNMKIAIAVGSRGVDKLVDQVTVTVNFLKELGAEPFIVPSMGSHGGATDEGQKQVLEHLGVKESVVGAEIRSSMEVIKLDELDNGLPIYVDKIASGADGMVSINRVKAHTAFRGRVESGIMKMICMCVGKQRGAEACHLVGCKHMADRVPEMAKVIISSTPILFAVQPVEHAFDQVPQPVALLPDLIEEKEIKLK